MPVAAEVIFARLDDHERLAAHMTRRSAGMLGSKMTLELDEKRGRAVGSRIHLAGRIAGIRLAVDEVVTVRDPPRRKTWETEGEPRLLVIGRYRMGFEIAPESRGSRLRVFLDCARPSGAGARFLARLLGASYAKWCTDRMVAEAAHGSP